MCDRVFRAPPSDTATAAWRLRSLCREHARISKTHSQLVAGTQTRTAAWDGVQGGRELVEQAKQQMPVHVLVKEHGFVRFEESIDRLPNVPFLPSRPPLSPGASPPMPPASLPPPLLLWWGVEVESSVPCVASAGGGRQQESTSWLSARLGLDGAGAGCKPELPVNPSQLAGVSVRARSCSSPCGASFNAVESGVTGVRGAARHGGVGSRLPVGGGDRAAWAKAPTLLPLSTSPWSCSNSATSATALNTSASNSSV